MDSLWIVGFDLEQSEARFMSTIYKTKSFSYLLHAKYPINEYLRFGLHYRIRAPNAEATNKFYLVTVPHLASDIRNKGLLSGVGALIGYDSTDRPVGPTSGFRSRLETECLGLGGDYYLISFGYINAWFTPLSKNSFFRSRADFRYIVPFGSTSYGHMPIDERLFLGGESVVRGYRPYTIGPKYPGTNQPRGGLSLNLISLEYIYQWTPRFEGFVFFDAGQLTQSVLNFGGLKTSVGFGFKIAVFDSVPPITLGYGFPINPKGRREVKRFFFAMGAGF